MEDVPHLLLGSPLHPLNDFLMEGNYRLDLELHVVKEVGDAAGAVLAVSTSGNNLKVKV